MSELSRARSAILTSLLMCCFWCAQAAAQGDGDYDGDGDVDGEDFFAFGGCMTGPGGAAPGCEAFDFGPNADGAVDMNDVAVMQRRPTDEDGCTEYLAHVRAKINGMGTGCRGKITTCPATLCGQAGQANQRAASEAWVGVIKRVQGVGSTGWKWAQAGYATWREQGSTAINTNRFFEIKVTPGGGVDVLCRTLSMPEEPGVPHEYSVDLANGQTSGVWTIRFDSGAPPSQNCPPPGQQTGAFLYISPNFAGWQNEKGTHLEWNAEIKNREDQLVGTEAVKCHFTECEYKVNWGAWQSPTISIGNTESDDTKEWRRDAGDPGVPNDFRVWDVDP